MTVTFQPAVKEQLKARVALAGPSGSGKTYSALRIARGLLGPGGRIAVIDTERRSASLYADEFTFDTLDFAPPYRPEGLRDAIRAAEQHCGPNGVLIIDSFTHFWSGPGGVLEIVDKNAKGGNSWSGWAVGTPLQQQVVDTMLTAEVHVIVCMRAKQEWALEKDERTGKQTPTRVGMGVQQRGDIEYEFTIFGELDLNHRLTVTKSRCKKLADRIEPMPGETLAAELLEWLSSGEDPNEPFVKVGWPSQHAHDDERAKLLDGIKALSQADLAELKVRREKAGLPSPGAGIIVSKTDMGRLQTLVASFVGGGDTPDGAPAGEESPQDSPPDPEPEPATTAERSRRVKANDPIGAAAYEAVKARVDALDPEYAEQFKADLFEAHLSAFSANSTKQDKAEVEGLLDIIERRNKPLWDHRRKEVFAALGKLPKMSDGERHVFVRLATGNETESTAKLTESQKDLVVAAVEAELGAHTKAGAA